MRTVKGEDIPIPSSPPTNLLPGTDFPTYCCSTYTPETLEIATHIAQLDQSFLNALNSHDWSHLSPLWSLCHPDWSFRDQFMPGRSIGIAEHVARCRSLTAQDPSLRVEGVRREVVVMDGGRKAVTVVVADVRGREILFREVATLSWRFERSAEGVGRWSCVRLTTMRGTSFELWGH